jgi:predicted regulator of Ras-like GTPase activity (Roadblock/LC7/MglB family)
VTDTETDTLSLNGRLDAFVAETGGISNAIVVSSDGLAIAMSAGIERMHADQLAAIVAGLTSLTRGASDCFNAGRVHQVIVEMDAGYLFVTAVSEGSSFAVLASPTADLGEVAYQMSVVVGRLGRLLTPELRAELQLALRR